MENNQGDKLGKKIMALRLKLDLSQDEFARKADIPYIALTKIKTEVIKKPPVFVMAKIAKALGFSIMVIARDDSPEAIYWIREIASLRSQ